MSSNIEFSTSQMKNDPSHVIVNINGIKAVVLNRHETSHIKDIDSYQLNQDPTPNIIKKKPETCIEYKQEIGVRTFKSSKQIPSPGKIIIRQEPDRILPQAPPLVIRQVNERVKTPKPLIIRQEPPRTPQQIPEKVIVVPGKKIRPPRRVVLEKLPPLPPRPQKIIIEKWVPYEKVKRRVIYEKKGEPVLEKETKNLVIEWETPDVSIVQKIKNLGVVETNPDVYRKKHKFTKKHENLPKEVIGLEKLGISLAKKHSTELPELWGDIEALKLIDLKKEGLEEYEYLIRDNTNQSNRRDSFSQTDNSFSFESQYFISGDDLLNSDFALISPYQS